MRFCTVSLATAVWLAASAPADARQITEGEHAMASTPALPPAQAQKSFAVPPGFEVRLFAAEPELVNPVAMTWDERGRLWVIELLQYPDKAARGQPGRDRIKIFEDTNNDGRADKVKVFADGLDLATGIARYGRGVLVGQAPELLYLEDTNGDDVADRRTSMLTGFSTEDTHELLNGFSWGPDGWLYFTHGVFNESKVKVTGDDDADSVNMTAALARFDPRRRRFEIFADGTSNPWGVDFDREGNAFVSACVIDHLFHLVPGGVYVRQSGSPTDPHAYDLLPSIVTHNHHRAAYAGVQVYQGDQYPADYRGMIVFGNIHSNAVNRDRLMPKGASFVAQEEPDFMKSSDPWFRPVSQQVGPDGNLWVADWYDRYPCYQNAKADPAGVDRTRGRIWRVVHTGGVPNAPRGSVRGGQRDLGRAPTDLLVATLADANVWHRRVAQRLLSERRDPASRAPLATLLRTGKSLEARLAALWTLHGAGLLDDALLDGATADDQPAVRTWAARLTGERADATPAALARLSRLAADREPTVRAGVATALRRLARPETQPIAEALAAQPGTGEDRVLTFQVWRAAEPSVARDPAPWLRWLRERGQDHLPFSAELARRVMRRVYDTGDGSKVGQAVAFLAYIARGDAQLVKATVDGLLEGQRGQSLRPRLADARALAPLYRHPQNDLAESARQLGAMWGDPAAAREILRQLTSADASITDRQRVVAAQVAANIPGTSSQRALMAALRDRKRPVVAAAAVRSLGKAGVAATPEAVLKAWPQLAMEVRAAAADVLTSRPAWAEALLVAVERQRVRPTDLPASVRRTLTRSKQTAIAKRAAAAFGRESSSEMRAIIAKKKAVVLQGPVDFQAGHEEAKKACLLCHRFYGEGGEVGPDLTGVGRATLDALLANVIDPNQVIGKGYEQVTVTTKDGRTISGRLVEETKERLTLLGLNVRETVPRAQVASVETSDVSVMPEGLDNLPDQAFRNLIWYMYQPPQDPTSRLRVSLRDKSLVVLARAADGKSWTELLTYVTDPALRPYLHPLRDLSGRLVLTDDRPSDHVWQHGVFTGLHGVNGLDFWTERQGKQRFVRLTDLQQETDRVLWKSLTEWVAPDGKVLLDEQQAVTVYAPASPQADHYAIDFEWTLKTRGEAVTFGQKEYGGLSVRMPLHERHTHLNARGDQGRAADTQRAAWATVERPFPDGSVWGIALMDHPGNDRHPAAWRVDKQGMISPSMSIQGEWRIPAFEQKRFRYRLVVYRGPANAAKMSRLYESFAAVPFVASQR